MDNALLRSIPKMDEIMRSEALLHACERFSYGTVKRIASQTLDSLRESMMDGSVAEPVTQEELEREIISCIERENEYSLTRVINASGTILHTNLGRAPLGSDVCRHLTDMCARYCSLEYDVKNGCRRSRDAQIEERLCILTGAQAALAVNNNAAAVYLMLSVLANGKKAAVSRGELVEIGGGFRIGELMELTGAQIIEIGAANRTHRSDYERAVNELGASVLVKVHASNFSVHGFTSEVELNELVSIGKELGCTVLLDAGAALVLPIPGVKGHTVSEYVLSGVDAVCFSGDKLFGSVQCGIICGKKEHIEKMRASHLYRILRPDKLTVAAMEASLNAYASDSHDKIPFVSMASMTAEECKTRAQALSKLISQRAPALKCSAVPTDDETGGGTLPDTVFSGYAVHVTSESIPAHELERRMRCSRVPIIARVQKNGVLFSVRTLFDGDDVEIADALVRASTDGGRT